MKNISIYLFIWAISLQYSFSQSSYTLTTGFQECLVAKSSNISGCITNGVLVTPCPAASAITELYCSWKTNVTDINGIQALTNIQKLVVTQCPYLNTIPNNLPNNLVRLELNDNGITNWPIMNSLANLDYLDISNNKINKSTSFVPPVVLNATNLPPNVKKMSISGNGRIDIQSLPTSLTHLDISGNEDPYSPYNNVVRLAANVTLPSNLISLTSTNNKLTGMPNISGLMNLKVLNVANNKINGAIGTNYFSSCLSSLLSFSCGSNKITALPTLPTSLVYLSCDTNELMGALSLTNQSNLKVFDCVLNKLTSISVHNNMEELYCSYNPNLTSIIISSGTGNKMKTILKRGTGGASFTCNVTNAPINTFISPSYTTDCHD